MLSNGSIFNPGPITVAYSHVSCPCMPAAVQHRFFLWHSRANLQPFGNPPRLWFFFFHLKKFCRGHCSCIDSFITFGVLDQMRLVQTLARLQQQAESPAQAFQTSDVVPVKAPYTSTWSVCIVDQFRPIQTRKFDDPEAVWQCLFPVLRPRFDGWCVLLMTLVWVT